MSTWVKTGVNSKAGAPNQGDWKKLMKMLGFLMETLDDVLMLEADDTQTLTWHIDVAFAMHEDMKSHTGSKKHWENK